MKILGAGCMPACRLGSGGRLAVWVLYGFPLCSTSALCRARSGRQVLLPRADGVRVPFMRAGLRRRAGLGRSGHSQTDSPIPEASRLGHRGWMQ